MPEWLQNLLITGGGLALIGTAIGTLYKAWREDRKLEYEARRVERLALIAKIEELQTKVQALLMDAIAREKDANIQMLKRIDMDAKQNEVIMAATTVLKDAALTMAKLESKL